MASRLCVVVSLLGTAVIAVSFLTDLRPTLGLGKDEANTLYIVTAASLLLAPWFIMMNFSSRLYLKTNFPGRIAKWFMQSRSVQWTAFGFTALMLAVGEGGKAREFASLQNLTTATVLLVSVLFWITTLTIMLVVLFEQRKIENT